MKGVLLVILGIFSTSTGAAGFEIPHAQLAAASVYVDDRCGSGRSPHASELASQYRMWAASPTAFGQTNEFPLEVAREVKGGVMVERLAAGYEVAKDSEYLMVPWCHDADWQVEELARRSLRIASEMGPFQKDLSIGSVMRALGFSESVISKDQGK